MKFTVTTEVDPASAREQKGGAMTLQRIDDLKEPPIVGRYYLVPCIKVTSAESSPVGFWPVTGPQHEDREIIGFAWRHWHYDFRFLTHAQHLRKTLDRGSVLCTAQGEHKEPGIAAEVVYKPRLCQREVLGFPAYKAHWLPQLRDAHADARVKCGKCPHRGLPLESLPREPGTDIVTCPGHGLRWDLKTGKMVI